MTSKIELIPFRPEFSRSSSMKAYTIGGVPILFPYKAYPSQISMMDKIVRCLNNKFNCLLESPTGSGKSLALLCACLGWQKKMRREIEALEAKLEEELNACGTSIPDDDTSKDQNKVTTFDKNKYEFVRKTAEDLFPKKCTCKPIPTTEDCQIIEPSSSTQTESNKKDKRGIRFLDEDDNDFIDFMPRKKPRSSTEHAKVVTNLDTPSKPCELCQTQKGASELNVDAFKKVPEAKDKSKKASEDSIESNAPAKLPRIYFGTRTHKQIAQIIRELKKTPYKDVKMSILSSRERTCIHPVVSTKDNKNEACDELLKYEEGVTCSYYKTAKSISHFHPREFGEAFDLEDLVSISRKAKACPYFGARELMQQSDIVFCPYNYLVDPLIRSAMNISLKNTIIIMDEAHNIEDSARSAASSSFNLSLLEECVGDLRRMGRHCKKIGSCYTLLSNIMSKVVAWMKADGKGLSNAMDGSSAKVYAEASMMAVLNYVELGQEKFEEFKSVFGTVLEDVNDPEKQKIIDIDEPKIQGHTINCLKSFVQILSYLYKNNCVYVPDYRIVLTKSKSLGTSAVNRSFGIFGAMQNDGLDITLNIWCLNPAVAFSDFKDLIHSCIVASGTLSPLISFQSELGLPFQVTLEANHVIAPSQTWIGTIGKGPSGGVLGATYQNSNTFKFQDDVGQLVNQVCLTIPHGVLCFLPSYSMMEKLVKRWKDTGLWEMFQEKKEVVCEPRRQNMFDNVIAHFYDCIKKTNDGPYRDGNGSKDGVLFFAICRGKVSEGLDFADNNARAVITIGIPFPNVKDTQVDLKKQYNNRYASARNLTTGQQWYEIQAFRALNQALGRCIRHRSDYGALIIVDERFQKNQRYPDSLSKWIRKDIVHYPSFPSALDSLNSFAERTGLKKNPSISLLDHDYV